MNVKNLSAEAIKSLLKGDSEVMLFNCLESTNSQAKGLAVSGKAKEGDVIIALSQSNGRGRMGRSFYSPKGCGIYFSIVLKPNIPQKDICLITPVAAVAVALAIEKATEKSPKIKWVNDIFINGKKVCGILSEAALNQSGGAEYVILGIGMNLNPPQGGYPSELKNIAGSIFESNEDFNANKLVADTVNEFFALYKDLYSKTTSNEYKKRMLLMGEEINYTQNGEQKSGVVAGIDEAFRLIIKNENCDPLHLQSGEVTIKSETI